MRSGARACVLGWCALWMRGHVSCGGRPSYVVVCVVSRLLPGAVCGVFRRWSRGGRAVFRLLSWAVSVRSEASGCGQEPAGAVKSKPAEAVKLSPQVGQGCKESWQCRGLEKTACSLRGFRTYVSRGEEEESPVVKRKSAYVSSMRMQTLTAICDIKNEHVHR